MARAATGIATGVTAANAAPALSCQEGMAGGISIAARASATTIGAARRPIRATVMIVMYTHRTNPAIRANGSSARNRAARMP